MTTTTKNQPTHRAFDVKGEGKSARWTEIGAAFAHGDGKGFNLTLDAIPMNGRIVLREIAERSENGGQE